MSGGGLVVLSPTDGVPSTRHVSFAADVRDTIPDPIQEARKIARSGNKYRMKNKYVSALERYSRSIAKLESTFGRNPDNAEAKLLLAKVYALRSLIYFFNKDLQSTVSDGRRAEDLEPTKRRFERLVPLSS
jgi:hypothetical protein